jgi:hypothetical protein
LRGLAGRADGFVIVRRVSRSQKAGAAFRNPLKAPSFSDPERNSYGMVSHLAGGAMMPINRLFRDGKIKSEEVERLNRAYSFTLQSLSLVDRDNDPVCEIIARKVVEIDAAGTREPKEIASLAVKQLGLP